MNKRIVPACALGTAALMLVSSVAVADQMQSGDIVVPPSEPAPAAAPAPDCDCDDSPNQGNVSLAAGVDVWTAYFFRGIMQERDGAIVQPWAEIGLNLWESDNGQSLSVVAGTWNSVHSNKTGATNSPTNWYESDAYAGLSIGLNEFLTTDLAYIAYASPNGAFDTVQEFAVGLSIDDSIWLGDFAMNPSMTWAFELDNTRFGNEEGVYLELGVEPGYELDNGISFSLPMTLGLAVDDYYETPQGEDTFGFFQFGFAVGVPLPVDEKFGSWSATAAFHGIALSGDLADANRRDGFFPMGMIGIAMEY